MLYEHTSYFRVRPQILPSYILENLTFPPQSPLCNLRNAPHPQHLISRAPAASSSVWAGHNPLTRLSASHRTLCPCVHRAPLTSYLGPGCSSFPPGTLGRGDADRDAARRLHPVQRGAASMRWSERGRNGIEADRGNRGSRLRV